MTVQPSGTYILRLYLTTDSNLKLNSPLDTPVNFSEVSVFPVLRVWLQKCDLRHKCMSQRREQQNDDFSLPTRVLDISNLERLRLDAAERMSSKRYAALSYCWGQFEGNKLAPWCTVTGNLRSRSERFSIDDLPKTIRDAVQVTRELDVQYLWVDSLCIVQGQDGDWEQESQRMEQVFASAYFTIAATSPTHSREGFLGVQTNSKDLLVRDGEDRVAYISSLDFDRDVENTALYKRAWVTQERFLSPRTIHFSRGQVYGECGEGICAGDNIFLHCNKYTEKYFRLDPVFRERIRSSGFITTQAFLEDVIEDFSQRGISVATDRAIAMSGLLARIAKTLPSPIHHGVIGWHLHRYLLWERVTKQRTVKIDYAKSTRLKIPSWSWMVYEGGIRFVSNKFGYLSLFRNLSFDEHTLRTAVWKLGDRGMKLKVNKCNSRHDLLDSKGFNVGWISLDEDEFKGSLAWNVVIIAECVRRPLARGDFLVLFVRLISCQDGYERIGIGLIRGACGFELVGESRIF